MTNLANEILEGAITGLLNKNNGTQTALRPKLVYNDTKNGHTVISVIESEFQSCETFWISAAFITKSGLTALKETLKELRNRNIRGKILTTDYLAFNEPEALKDLLQFKNLEVRVFTGDFHTKGYMFINHDKRDFIVGSSNITQSALKTNKEWNLKITSLVQGALIKETETEFYHMWNQSVVLTEDWIQHTYEPFYRKKKKERELKRVERIRTYILTPNHMQHQALKALKLLREEKKDRALLISATGTGKTYLAAFDVRNFQPKKMLFLVHREQILNQAVESFKDVLGNQIDAGIVSGSNNAFDADYLFSTMQMMAKDHVLTRYQPEYFDYIIIDEAHKAGAVSYMKIIQYFKPKFLLGMTASPERPDGIDIFGLFHHNIAYEIRLNEAMEEDLLCPFHYFGISEFMVNGEVIKEDTEFTYLVSWERVNNIIENAEFYGHGGDRLRGLIFCSTNAEASELSRLFNERGYNTAALSGKNSQEEREAAIRRLEQEHKENGLDYIFTVDIFNEGVDIPSVNQVIMLRPTQSPIVFVQQLGRGLRKAWNKEFVVVIDFIGNYKNNFFIPIALSGDRTYNKDAIRKYMMEGNRIIPGCSTIHFDEVSKKRIYEAVNKISFKRLTFLKEEYNKLKDKMGRIPTLKDFYENGSIDPSLILLYSKSYYTFLVKAGECLPAKLSNIQVKMLECVSLNLSNGKRPHELLALNRIMKYKMISKEELKQELLEKYQIKASEESLKAAMNLLEGKFWGSSADKNNYKNCEFIKAEGQGHYLRCLAYDRYLQERLFKQQMQQLLDLGLARYEREYRNTCQNTDLVLYQKYSRKDACHLLNWESDESSVLYGYKIKHGRCLIFITYNKAENIEEGLKYDEYFISKEVFSWMTKPDVKLSHGFVKQIMGHKESGLAIDMFMNKSNEEGKEFYYLGEAEAMDFKEKTTIHKSKVKPIVNIIFHLKNPVREDIYEYMIN